MLRKALVYNHGTPAGVLEEANGGFSFHYLPAYLSDPSLPPVSLTLPKRSEAYLSPYLFPFFFRLVSEGDNRMVQSRLLKTDEKDYFGLLLATARHDTIGSVTLKPCEDGN